MHRYSANAPSRFTPTPTGEVTQMTTTGTAVTAVTTGDMAFAGNTLTEFQSRAHLRPFLRFRPRIRDQRAYPYRNSVLRPLIPMVDMHICTTDRCLANLDQYIVITRFRLWLVCHPDTFFSLSVLARVFIRFFTPLTV